MAIESSDAVPPVSMSMARGSARTFRPSTAGVLRVISGRAWATLNPSDSQPQARWCPEMDAGDIFVGPGSGLRLQAGQSVVIESWPVDKDRTTFLEWEATVQSPSPSYWQNSVRLPAHELGLSMVQVVRALLGYFEMLVPSSSKGRTCLESNRR